MFNIVIYANKLQFDKLGLVPESQPLVNLFEKASVELIDGVDVGEQEGHETLRHCVFFNHCTAEPLRTHKNINVIRHSSKAKDHLNKTHQKKHTHS